MAEGESHIEVLKQGATVWNEWREAYPEIQPDLSKADLRGANLSRADLKSANLGAALLRGAILNNVNLAYANLSKANLRGVSLWKANLWKADLKEADLSNANLSKATMIGAILSNANLTYADLSGANLKGANLWRANLWRTNLREADLGSANLREANLSDANLWKADLDAADLDAANLSKATLSNASMVRAILSNTTLIGTDMRETDLTEATIFHTVFTNIDLRTTKGLVEIHHQGPSHMELYTVQLPQDGSALHFLRGAGVPDEWINDYRIHMMHPIQYHSCFISYSSRDEALIRRLHADLQDQGVRCWFAPEDMKIGSKIRSHIDEAIHLQDKLLLVLSKHSLASAWVEDEVETALEKERRQQREILFPVRLDESVMQTNRAWAVNVRRRHIGDFTNWADPQAYQQAFERLLRDLKSN